VYDDRHAVGAQLHVGLEREEAAGEREVEGGERVFGGGGAVAAVCDQRKVGEPVVHHSGVVVVVTANVYMKGYRGEGTDLIFKDMIWGLSVCRACMMSSTLCGITHG